MFKFPKERFLIYQFGISLLGAAVIALGVSILFASLFAGIGWTSLIIGLLSFFGLFVVLSYLLVIQSAKWFKLKGSWKHSFIATILFLPFALLGLDWWFVLLLPVVQLVGFYYKKKKK